MLATFVKPVSAGLGSAAILVFLESILVSSVPTFAYVFTSIGPFVPIIANSLTNRRALSTQDANDVYIPLFPALVKVRQEIAASENMGSYFPNLQRDDRTRTDARYLILKNQIPAVGGLFESIDAMLAFTGDAMRAASQILKHEMRDVLKIDADEVSFQGRTRDGGTANFGSYEVPVLLVRDRDAVEYYTRQRFEVTSMTLTEKTNAVKGKLEFPVDDRKYRQFWDRARQKASDDAEIRKMRDILVELSSRSRDAEAQVFEKVKRSRSSF